MKRVLCLILTVAVFVSAMIIPAAATSVSGSATQAGTQYINYLTADGYYIDGVDTDLPVYSPYSSFKLLNLKFYPDNFSTADYMMFSLSATSKPSRVSVRFTSDGQYADALYEGFTDTSNGLFYYFYRVDMSPEVDFVDMDIGYDSGYSNEIRLFSCFGVRSLLDEYDRADFNVVTKTDGSEGVALEKRTNLGTKTFPYTYRNDTTDDLNSADFTIRLDSDRFDTTAVDRVSLLLTTYSETMRVTASLVPRDASVQSVSNIQVNLTMDKEWGLVNNYESGAGTVYNYVAYQIDVDLHGYDLDKYELFFYVSVDPVLYVNASSVSNPRLLEVTFRSINYVPTTFDIPWYVSLVDDIRSYFENLTIEVMGIIDSLDIYWENFFDRWDSRWDNLMIKLEEYFGEDGELAEKGDAMSEQAEQMQQANDAMSSVEKPSVDTGAMLDQYLNFNPSALALLAVFTNNAFVTPMLVVIFTFALCGYIFFGKRR